MLTTLMNSPIAWAALASIAIVSFIYAIASNHKNKERKEFAYCLRSRTLIRKKKRKYEKLAIAYDGHQIDDLCVSNYTIWNSGNRTLNANDMVASKELTITASEESKILDVEIIARSEETNRFSVEQIDEHTVKVLFEYVDKMEGVVVQIIHTGTNDSLTVNCKIKGGRPVKNYINDKIPRLVAKTIDLNMSKKRFIVVTIFAAAVLLFLCLSATIAIFDKDLSERLFSFTAQGSIVYRVFMASLAWLYCLFFVILSIPAMKMKYKIGMPTTLKKYSGFDD